MGSDSPVILETKPPPRIIPLDPEEQLARFREEWRAEVRRRKLEQTGETSAETTSDSIGQPSKGKEVVVHVTRIFQEAAGKPVAKRTTSGSAEIVKHELSETQRTALEAYERAIVCEQRGELDEALQLYRKAFRGYDNVDRLHTHFEKASWAQEKVKAKDGAGSSSQGHTHARTESKEVEQLTHAMHHLDVTVVSAQGASGNVTGTLASLVSSWAESLQFLPEEEREREPVFIARMPDEVLVHILANLDIASLEQFASVNRKARVLTLDSSIWRSFVQRIYKPPQIQPDENIPTLLADYLLDHRRMFVEHPRIRLDGVYIAVLHYTRRGLSENAWVNINHLITYHRYLRFYPDGTVLSLLANEEVAPQQVIPILKPSLRMKGFYAGNWSLSGTSVLITDLTDPSPPGSDPPKYTFQMTLELKSRPLGRWNRLNFVTYESTVLVLEGAFVWGIVREYGWIDEWTG
ncbi:hypothetical protein EUX98_g6446 [Antrodiella citrinella]|uniref:F-box domain-containing protein n=1 Tax=Antrodiella citrinella TaxID=2447956 RepID=A0A4S4MNZ3_9APHY|nr:hypothetical protein EUX98_g6446 [Antrodiella citrinella]